MIPASSLSPESVSRTVKPNLSIYRCAVALATLVVLLIALGAVLTSEIQPIPGYSTPAVLPSNATVAAIEQAHIVAGIIIGILALGLALWLQGAEKRSWLKVLGWSAVVVAALGGWLGTRGVLVAAPRTAGFFHALLAQILLSIVVAIAVGVSPGWSLGPLVEDSWHPPLRSLALALPAFAFLQVLLGAGYRHGVMGVLWHILNAMIVVLVVLIVSMLVIRQFPEHPSLRPAALTAAIITGVQAFLGFATFIILLIITEPTLALLLFSVTHVVVGALTLASTVVVAMQIRCYVRVPQRQTPP
jgi:heme A synthase